MRPLRTCCLSFLSRRFSLSVLPDFFDTTFRGDLSAIVYPPFVSRSYSRGTHPGRCVMQSGFEGSTTARHCHGARALGGTVSLSSV